MPPIDWGGKAGGKRESIFGFVSYQEEKKFRILWEISCSTYLISTAMR